MADGSPSERTASPPGTEAGGIGPILYAGVFLGLGFVLLFDTTAHLSSLYKGSVSAPIEIWIRVLLTAILGSVCVLASLSVVLQNTRS